MHQGLAQKKLMPCAGLVPPVQKESHALLDPHSPFLQPLPSALAVTRAPDGHVFSPPANSRLLGCNTPVSLSLSILFSFCPHPSPCTTTPSYQPGPSTASHELMASEYYYTGVNLCTSMQNRTSGLTGTSPWDQAAWLVCTISLIKLYRLYWPIKYVAYAKCLAQRLAQKERLSKCWWLLLRGLRYPESQATLFFPFPIQARSLLFTT